MRSSAEAAFNRLADVWDTILAERDGGEHECARELFRAARLLEGTPTLGKALTDPARASSDRSRLALDVFGIRVRSRLGLLSGLPRDLGSGRNHRFIKSLWCSIGAGRAGSTGILSQLRRSCPSAAAPEDQRISSCSGDRCHTADDARIGRSILLVG